MDYIKAKQQKNKRTNSTEITKCISIFPDSHLALAGSLLKRRSKEKRFRAGLGHDDISKLSPSPRVNVTAVPLSVSVKRGRKQTFEEVARTLQTREAVAKLTVFEFENTEVFQAFFFFF